MHLDKLNTTRFHSDKSLAQRSAKEQLKFINANFSAFSKEAHDKAIKAFQSFWNMYRRKESFSNKQLSYIDGLYEKTMEGLGFESVKNQKSKYGVNLKA